MSADEFFGNSEKTALMKRAAALWVFLSENPRYAYYGRIVALSDPSDDTADILCSLARLQGAGIAYYFPKQSADDLFAELERRGFSTDRHEHYWGGEAAYQASRAALAQCALPADLTVSILDRHTPQSFVAQVAELCQSCEVMPVPGEIMRGTARRGINLVASDELGKPVGSACSFVMHHQSSSHFDDVFWGMLATREDRRGEKIALVLGALAIVHMWEKEGARGFMTGVRQKNRSSQVLCNKLGVTDSKWIYAHCLDTGVLGTVSVTK